MAAVLDRPGIVFLLAFFILGLAALLGVFCQKVFRPLRSDERKEFEVVQSSAMTLLALIVGFTFSMAVSRYDQRKSLEAAEANAIGTEYVRLDLAPEIGAKSAKALLKSYVDQRIAFFSTGDEAQLEKVGAETADLRDRLWLAAREAATAQPSPVTALVAAGMNDVLNAQDYTQAAWWNRIPAAAWLLLVVIAMFCNLLLGYGQQRFNAPLLLATPLLMSISFFLIADIDSPRGGVIQVGSQNLSAFSQSVAER